MEIDRRRDTEGERGEKDICRMRERVRRGQSWVGGGGGIE